MKAAASTSVIKERPAFHISSCARPRRRRAAGRTAATFLTRLLASFGETGALASFGGLPILTLASFGETAAVELGCRSSCETLTASASFGEEVSGSAGTPNWYWLRSGNGFRRTMSLPGRLKRYKPPLASFGEMRWLRSGEPGRLRSGNRAGFVRGNALASFGETALASFGEIAAGFVRGTPRWLRSGNPCAGFVRGNPGWLRSGRPLTERSGS